MADAAVAADALTQIAHQGERIVLEDLPQDFYLQGRHILGFVDDHMAHIRHAEAIQPLGKGQQGGQILPGGFFLGDAGLNGFAGGQVGRVLLRRPLPEQLIHLQQVHGAEAGFHLLGIGLFQLVQLPEALVPAVQQRRGLLAALRAVRQAVEQHFQLLVGSLRNGQPQFFHHRGQPVAHYLEQLLNPRRNGKVTEIRQAVPANLLGGHQHRAAQP